MTTERQDATPASSSAADLAAAVTEYYALMPANTDEGWVRLTDDRSRPGSPRTASITKTSGAWIDRVLATDVSGDPPDHAEATVSYYLADGRVSVERTTYRLVQDGPILKLDTSAVLSSRTG